MHIESTAWHSDELSLGDFNGRPAAGLAGTKPIASRAGHVYKDVANRLAANGSDPFSDRLLFSARYLSVGQV